ncbi:DUF488 family protein [Seleniivibrio woodruffii]|uniref:DUF488 domain-containing protein n=1 Tax=Seleniivibrio woodruffii TaxID=1078050 RepID=UPI00240A3DAF|nr:DUF488 domain-containing protein [Seleniivibrio woodruffii]
MKIKIFTIGFTQKSAEVFFSLLMKANVSKIIDIRLNNSSQLAGFAKGNDLKYFVKKICGIDYEHDVNLAPTGELLKAYKDKQVGWDKYKAEYKLILDKRNILQNININDLHQCCLLCSEHLPDFCHRRLLAEYLQHSHNDVEIIHLVK